MVIGSAVSVFGKEKIHAALDRLKGKSLGTLGIIPACALGIASPLCMYGTIPIAASFSEKGLRDDWLASFMTASILLNPQLIVYSAALGKTALAVRIVSCFLCGTAAGLIVRIAFHGKPFFRFSGFGQCQNRNTAPSLPMRFIRNFGRNLKATGPYFVFGILISALFQRYVPAESFARLFGKNEGFGVLMAATVGVPLYACGGGTIPLLQHWLTGGMSIGSAAAFMITGPATKITNLGALKIVFGAKNFLLYIAFIIIFAFACGSIVNLIL